MAMYVIDGTGDYQAIKNWWIGRGYRSTADYDNDMKNSFCNQIRNQLSESRCKYWRGPDVSGNATIVTALQAAYQASNSTDDVSLAGYSRGAAAVIEACHYLQIRGIPVQGLFLFDPVKRDYSLPNADVIPSNVRNVYKITRLRMGLKNYHQDFAHWLPQGLWETEVSVFTPSSMTGEQYGDQQGRKWMLNCGNVVQNPHRTNAVFSEPIDGSHGAMGGVGYGAVPLDMGAELGVVDFMNAAFKFHHIPVTLKSYWNAWHKSSMLDGKEEQREALRSAKSEAIRRNEWNRQTDLGNHT